MQFRTITRIVGLLIILFSAVMSLPALVAVVYRDGDGRTFSTAFFVILLLGLLLWFPNKQQKSELKTREGFLIVTLFWAVIGSVGALPFILSEELDLSLTDAFFESFSGLTTTGATTLQGLDSLPKAILFYRSLLQWIGGMGIIVLAVAILPLLGVGGMQLYKAEVPGPQKDNKMRPRIAETAKTLWSIYLLLTVMCAISLWLAGMRPFDAVNHSMSIVAIGGFSTHDAGLGFYDSHLVSNISVGFLFLAGCNFALHFSAMQSRSIKTYFNDPEFKMYFAVQCILIFIVMIMLMKYAVYDSVTETVSQVVFQVVAMTTTSGILKEDITHWPLFVPVLLLMATFMGGCAGSTGGGLKVIRLLLLCQQGTRELKRLVHPNAIYLIKVGNRAVPDRVIEAIWGYLFVYVLVFSVSLLALMATGLDAYSAFTGTTSALNNVGTGMGNLSSTYGDVSVSAKWILIITMLFGRLEIFTLLVLFTRSFWQN